MIVIPGRPVPKKRPAIASKGRKAYLYTPEATRDYENYVRLLARQQIKRPLRGPLLVLLTIHLRKGPRGDLDNYVKSVLDGLNGIAYEDDKQVTHIEARFETCKPGQERVEVCIQEEVPA